MLRSNASRSRIRQGVWISVSRMPGAAGMSKPTSRAALVSSTAFIGFGPVPGLRGAIDVAAGDGPRACGHWLVLVDVEFHHTATRIDSHYSQCHRYSECGFNM